MSSLGSLTDQGSSFLTRRTLDGSNEKCIINEGE